MATKWCSLDFQPERAKGKAWPWSGCGDADVKRGSALGPGCVKTCTDEKSLESFFLAQPLNEFYRNTVRDANGSLSRILQIKLSNCAAVRACDPPDAGTEF